MNSNQVIKIIGVVVVAIILLYSFLPGEKLSYEETIARHRQETDDFMRTHPDSPLPDSVKQGFSGLNYFEPNPTFKVNASLEPVPGNPVILMATSDGETRRYKKYAYAYFDLAGVENRLTLFQAIDEDNNETLFLPFGDTSNGDTTYGGGRYLDLKTTNNSNIIIDFNLAYNPYCVFSVDYSCPLPPAENQLSIEVRVGEKNYH